MYTYIYLDIKKWCWFSRENIYGIPRGARLWDKPFFLSLFLFSVPQKNSEALAHTGEQHDAGRLSALRMGWRPLTSWFKVGFQEKGLPLCFRVSLYLVPSFLPAWTNRMAFFFCASIYRECVDVFLVFLLLARFYIPDIIMTRASYCSYISQWIALS